jgi:polyhydroxybutyrate depolymerase
MALSSPARAAAVIAAVAIASSACSRADLYAITVSSADGGSGDSGSNDGGAGESGVEPGPCASAAPPGDTTHTLLVDGVSRSYVLHVPDGHDGATAVPLVMDFHGIGDSGADQRMTSPYPERLDPEGVVMAFPDGLRGPAGTAWNVGPCCVEDADDLAFARALVADVSRRACIDPKRVYAVGVLTGGGMAHYLGCHAADLFAAIAPAAFDLLEENVDDCAPPRGVSVISFRGTAPSRVPYEGGPSSAVPGMPLTFLGAQGTFEAWAEINDCTPGPSPEDARGCASYTGCRDGAEVVLCTKQDGAEENGDPEIAWPLLSRHTL